MRRPSIVAVLALLALIPSAVAEPISITGTKSAIWNSPTGGPSIGAGTDWLRFGEFDAASLGWSGNSTFSATTGDPFSLGIVWLTNGSSINPPTQATFSVTLDINTPTDEAAATFDFDAHLVSTNNAGGGDLKFAITPGQTATWTSSNGKTYTLEMLGLSNNWEWDGQTFSEMTALADCETNQSYAWVYAKISIEESATLAHVPEPGSLLLAGIGLGFLALRRLARRDRML